VFRVAADGDPIAGRIIARQAEEIVTIATVTAGRLDLLDQPFSVVLGGGVLRTRHPLLLDPILAALAAGAPKATVSVVDAPPVLGAALSALDALAAPPSARDAVRRALVNGSPVG
jgi:hypothetical protein